MTKQQKIGSRRRRTDLLPASFLDGKAPPDDLDFGEICRRVIADPTSSALDKFRAMDKLEAKRLAKLSALTDSP